MDAGIARAHALTQGFLILIRERRGHDLEAWIRAATDSGLDALGRFTTVNFDFLQHYRPKVNVVERPHAKKEGRGYAITGHHELMIPLLAAALIERDA